MFFSSETGTTENFYPAPPNMATDWLKFRLRYYQYYYYIFSEIKANTSGADTGGGILP